MSVVKEYGKYVPTCDICGEHLEPTNTKINAVRAMLIEGWKAVHNPDTDEDENYCTDCQEIIL